MTPCRVGIACAGLIVALLAACAEQPVDPGVLPDAPRFGATVPFNNTGACLGNDMVAWNELVGGVNASSNPALVASCTAADVMVHRVDLTEVLVNGAWVPASPEETYYCDAGGSVSFRATAVLRGYSALARLDAGLWLATDGGDAKTGSCSHFNIPTSPLPSGASNADGDQCGDLAADSTLLNLGTLTMPCTAAPDGHIEFGSCTAWSTAGADRVCPVPSIPGPDGFRAGTLPDNLSKCSCTTMSVPIQPSAPQQALLEVRKACSPESDDGTFDLAIDGVVLADNAVCGGTTGARAVSAGSQAVPGAFHTFAESDFPASSYTTAWQCQHRGSGATVAQCGQGGNASCAGSGPGPVDIRTDPGQDIVCTFANTRQVAPSTGSISLQNSSFNLLRNTTTAALSGSIPVRNASGGGVTVTVTGIEVTQAWVKQGNTQTQHSVTGCAFAPLPVSIPAGATQAIAVTGCDVFPGVDNRKDLNFTFRVHTTGTAQPFAEKTYKAKAQ
ncbi:MAG TPA: hypothetical protein VK936_10615 [Longimicrobiales bacterium]|nr:hypothetical protein [Longimicrobiales bacterium]